MPPPIARVASFSVDIEDWHSCTPSDDDAYQEALERNSNASFFTCRTHAPSVMSNGGAQNEPESPTRLQDADAALAGLVPEPLSEAKLQHAAPAMEPCDTPAAKKTKSSAALPPPAPLAAGAQPAARHKPAVTRRTTPMRSASPRTTSSPSPALAAGAVADADADSSNTASEPALVRVHIIPRPDDSGVQLQILPSVLCLFGSVPFPAPSTSSLDFAAALLLQAGGRSEAVSSGGGAPEDTGTSPAPARSEGGASAGGEDPVEQKDQSSKARRGAADKAGAGGGNKDAALDPRKSQAAFPGSTLLKRIFSGFGGSNGSNSGSAPPPASVQELGAELLSARGCSAVDTQLAAAAAASATVVAGYVQTAAVPVPLVLAGEASAASAGSVPLSPEGGVAAGAAGTAAAEAEAAAAVHRMSTDIFRNVLRVSGGGGGGDVSSPGKAMRSPRDTAFLSTAAAAKAAAAATASPLQRDQAPAASATDTGAPADSAGGKKAPAATLARASATAASIGAAEGSPCKDEQSAPGVAALALLAGLAAPPGAQAPAAIRVGGGLAAAGSLEMLAPGPSGDMSEGGGLPMPDLEKCESPVMAKAAAAGSSKLPGGSPPPLAAAASEEIAQVEEVTLSVAAEQEEQGAEPEPPAGMKGAAVLPVPTAAAAAVADAGATASPRTVSKKAYGTVANIVRKMVPGFRDSALMAVSGSAEGAVAAPPPPPRPPVAPRAAKAPAGPKAPATVAAVAAVAAASSAEQTVQEAQKEQADAAAQSPGAPMFIFGQEQPKTGKTPVIRPRPISAKPAASPAGAAGEPTTPVDAAGRKRKSELEDLPIAKMPVSAGKSAATGVNTPSASAEPEAPSPAVAKPATQELSVAPAVAKDAAAPREVIVDAGCATPAAEAVPVAAEQARALHHSATSEIEPTAEGVTPAPEPAPVVAATPAAEAPAQQQHVKPASGAGKKQGGGGLFACFGCFKA